MAKVSESELESRAPGVVSVPAWREYPWLHAGFSTRRGGQSSAYGDRELNLGWTSSDEAANVAANRERFVRSVVADEAMELVTIQQFHGDTICTLDREHGTLATEEGKAVLRGDAMMTDIAGLLLGIQTADCVPVLIADTHTRAVAAFHAGWRGTLARIVEDGVETMQRQYGSRPKDLVAAIGPAIGSCCFAIGEEVRSDFESQFAYSSSLFSEVFGADLVHDKDALPSTMARAPGDSSIGSRIHMDLFEANRRQLLAAGVPAAKITVVGECTACTQVHGVRKYFSHRAEHGFTGRMLSVIGVSASR